MDPEANSPNDTTKPGKEKTRMGMTYQRGAVWWVKYYRNGRPMRESSGSTKESDAIQLLKIREAGLKACATKTPHRPPVQIAMGLPRRSRRRQRRSRAQFGHSRAPIAVPA